MKREMKKRIRTLAACIVLAAGMLSGAVFPSYAEDVTAIRGPEMAAGINGIRKGDVIHFGKLHPDYSGDPEMKWLVMDPSRDNAGGENAVFVMSEKLIGDKGSKSKPGLVHYYNHTFNLFRQLTGKNKWHNSDMPKWCSDFYFRAFSEQEEKAVRSVSKKDSTLYEVANFSDRIRENNGYTDVSYEIMTLKDEIRNQKVFFPSYEELMNESDLVAEMPGYDDDQVYWTRTPGMMYPYYDLFGLTRALVVTYTDYSRHKNYGNSHYPAFEYEDVINMCWTRPAMNIEGSAVLFSNASGAKEKNTVGTVTEMSTTSGNNGEWDLTVLDYERSTFNAKAMSLSADRKNVTVDYEGNHRHMENDYISVIFKDADGNITRYGRVARATDDQTGTVTVPLNGDEDGFYIFQEEYTGRGKTSYASPLQYIDLKNSSLLHTVTYDLNGHGGPQPPGENVPNNAQAHKPQDPSAEGYDFRGWFTDKACTQEYDFSALVTADLILYAKWEAKNYTIRYMSPESKEPFVDQARKVGDEKGLIDNPFTPPEGWHHFTEWNDDQYGNGESYEPGYTGDLIDKADSEGNARLYAQWSNFYTVGFSLNGHTGSPPEDQSVFEPWKIEKPADPQSEGYDFKGWYKTAACSDGDEWDFDKDTVSSDMTLYAKWTAAEYTISFDPGRGTAGPDGLMEDQQRTVGDGESLPPCRYLPPAVSSGAVFTGWNTKKNGSGETFEDGSTQDVAMGGSVTLYAQWSESRVAVFDLNGHGSGAPAPQMRGVQHDYKLKEPSSDPSAEGYAFSGWYKDAACSSAWDFDNDRLEKPLTRLYAGWTPNRYTVIFEANPPEGTTASGDMSEQARRYDDGKPLPKMAFTITNESQPGEHYVFCGWNTDKYGSLSGDTFGDEDSCNITDKDGDAVTLYAQWNTAQITTSRLPLGRQSEPYKTKLKQNGFTNETWNVIDGELPEGFSLNGQIGEISGRSPQAGRFSFTVEVSGTDSMGGAASMKKELSVTLMQKDPEPLIIRFTEGMNGIWTKGDTAGLKFATNGPFGMFESLDVDGKELVRGADYEADSGSTLISLKPAMLEKLSAGSHILTAHYNDGQEPFTQFTVAEKPDDEKDKPKPDNGDNIKPSPDNDDDSAPGKKSGRRGARTGDEAHVTLWAMTFVTALMLLAVQAARSKRRKR